VHCLRLCFEEEPRKMPGLRRIAVRRGRLLKDRLVKTVLCGVILHSRGFDWFCENINHSAFFPPNLAKNSTMIDNAIKEGLLN
jgi:hypothetical protein